MKTKKQKQDRFKVIKDKLNKAKIIVFTSFAQEGSKGLSVSAMRELRSSLRPLDSEYASEKKTVMDKALQSDKHESHVFEYPGSLGITYGYGDPYATAKTLHLFAKKNAALKLYSAIIDGKFVGETELMEIALMPSKEILLSRLVGMLSYPMRSFAVVLDQIAKTK